MPRKAVVVGAGIGGLSSAALLAKEGFDVTVLERCGAPGGRARLWEYDGFAFDMGPSWYLMPEVFERYFSLFGRSRSDFYGLKKLDPHYQVFFGSGDRAVVGPDFRKTKALFESYEQGGGGRLDAYVAASKYKYETAMRDFLYRDYRSVFQFLNRRLMTEGLRLNVFKSLDSYVGSYFSDTRAKQLLEYAMVFLGSSPANAPAMYSLMSYLDLQDGVYFPEGGMHAVVEALLALCGALGVKIELNAEVAAVDSRARRVSAVRFRRGGAESELPADAVVVNADYAHAELDLLSDADRSYRRRYWEKAVLAPSMLIAYLGVDGKVPGLEHHNLYFAERWDDHFDAIFKNPAWPADPCFYLSAPSKTDKRAAPAGKENLFLLIPAAPGLDDRDEIREAVFERALSKIEGLLGTELRSRIRVKRLFSQRDFSADYRAYKGTALSLAHTLSQTAVFRPSMRSKRVAGLYYAGQYTHPGVGVPMTLIASEIVVPLVVQDLRA